MEKKNINYEVLFTRFLHEEFEPTNFTELSSERYNIFSVVYE